MYLAHIIARVTVAMALLATTACERSADLNAAVDEQVVDCPALRAVADRFNKLDAKAQQNDVATHAAVKSLPKPVGFEEVPAAGNAYPVTITLKSGGCELTFLAKSSTAEAQIRNE